MRYTHPFCCASRKKQGMIFSAFCFYSLDAVASAARAEDPDRMVGVLFASLKIHCSQGERRITKSFFFYPWLMLCIGFTLAPYLSIKRSLGDTRSEYLRRLLYISRVPLCIFFLAARDVWLLHGMSVRHSNAKGW